MEKRDPNPFGRAGLAVKRVQRSLRGSWGVHVTGQTEIERCSVVGGKTIWVRVDGSQESIIVIITLSYFSLEFFLNSTVMFSLE